MRNRLLISTIVHFLLGILFVFPIYTAEGIEHNSNILVEIGFYGEKDDDDASLKSQKKRVSYSTGLFDLKNIWTFSFIPTWICEGNPGSRLLLKFSQQIVDISFQKCIRSVVILC